MGQAGDIDQSEGYLSPGAPTPPTLPPAAVPLPSCSVSAPFTDLIGRDTSGAQVRTLQTLLQCLGYFPKAVSPTGFYGPTTEASVIAFQRAKGLGPVGFLSTETRTALNVFVTAPAPAPTPVPTPVVVAPPAPPVSCTSPGEFTEFLTAGTVSAQVRPLQELLQCLGYFPKTVAPSGTYGPTTEASVRAFQKSVGVDPVGYVGPATRAKLNTY